MRESWRQPGRWYLQKWPSPRAMASVKAKVHARTERRYGSDDAHTGERRCAWAVLYDADCGFCKCLLAALLRWDRAARLHPIALQRSEADDLLYELTPAERMESWHLISPAGERRSAGAAVPPLLRLLPAGRLPAAGFARFPRLTDRGYRWVAEHRSQLSKWVPSSVKQRASERVRQRETRCRHAAT